MIASWMLYTLAIGILTTIAAAAAARAFDARGWPTRFVWASALVISVVWPVASLTSRLLPESAAPVTVLPFTIMVEAPAAVVSENADRALTIERALLGLWIVLSLVSLVRIASAVRVVERSRRLWRRGRVDGMRVKISENMGPAVVGLGTMDVVLPSWILSLDAPLRAIVLRHEEEHRLARDPQLLFGAAIVVALMPWNLALWYHARRLRLAVELDCDARVLRAHPSPERYGMLMLTIAQRRSTAPAMFAPMLTEPTTNLERRIVAMRSKTKKLARVTAYGGGLVAAGTLLLASSLQSAPRGAATTEFSTPLTRAVAAVAEPALEQVRQQAGAAAAKRSMPDTATVRRLPAVKVASRFETAQAGNPAPRYPDLLRSAGVEGGVVARYTTNAQGVPDSASIEILQSSHRLFTNAVLRVLPLWHMAPNTTIETPFTFAMPTSVTRGENGAANFHGRTIGGVVVVASLPAPTAVPMKSPGGAPTTARSVPESAGANGAQTYFEFQSEQPARPIASTASPRYPDLLRSARVEGTVLAQFIVVEDGVPQVETFKVLKSDHDLFTMAVKNAMPNMRFTPSLIGGKRVRQLVQMPFQFSLSKDEKP